MSEYRENFIDVFYELKDRFGGVREESITTIRFIEPVEPILVSEDGRIKVDLTGINKGRRGSKRLRVEMPEIGVKELGVNRYYGRGIQTVGAGVNIGVKFGTPKGILRR